jgi:subtilisin family serine protease
MLEDSKLLDLIYGGDGARRYTQDSPVMADVWLEFFHKPDTPADLLLTPFTETTAADLSDALRHRLEQDPSSQHEVQMAYTETYVVARLSLRELLWAALPLSSWWLESVLGKKPRGIRKLIHDEGKHWPKLPPRADGAIGQPGPGSQLEWFVDLAGLVAGRATGKVSDDVDQLPERTKLATYLIDLLGEHDMTAPKAPRGAEPLPLLWTVNLNRVAYPAVSESRLTVKADAAERLFKLSARNVTWAVIDTGIDATHPAFADRTPDGQLPQKDEKNGYLAHSRVACTFDFTNLRGLQEKTLEPGAEGPVVEDLNDDEQALHSALESGRMVQWELLKPLLALEHDDDYVVPEHAHGTHVASVLAGDWRSTDDDMPGMASAIGISPDMKLYDLRAMGKDGLGDEFAVLAAMQFVRFLNAQHDRPVIHGVNLSLSIHHKVRNYAAGRTPVCEEAERLVASGVVVVAAAGNEGFAFAASSRDSDAYRTVSITDPGNAEGVITVGATHRNEPHTYGVSFFSSRGPTGDGRVKPDLVAPGEKIQAAVPGPKLAFQDGTSMAAPHVSGAAALILARHRELVGQPARIKEILCSSATDLGREHYFQGAGLVDVLRALQSV